MIRTDALEARAAAMPMPGQLEGMIGRVLATDASWATAVLRVTLGIVMFPHGAQKLFGWFGGYGFDGTMGFFTEAMGLPWIVGLLVIGVEFFGSIALVLGALSRVAAFGIASVMAGAIFTVHLSSGFFMDWSGTMTGEGFEFHLLAIAMAVAVLIAGSGAFSLDRRLAEWQDGDSVARG